MEIVGRGQILKGKKVLITSGPTREPIDDVRFLSNRSSGKMGAALAKAALLLGAEVTVITGPSATPMPFGARVIGVETALQMLKSAEPEAKVADIIVGAAAVADYRPKNPAKGKIRRTNDPLALDLVPNPDIIAELAKVSKKNAMVVGFAAEPDPDLETASAKLKRKGLAAIAVNDVSRKDIGFESDRNELTLLRADGSTVKSGVQSKLGCAIWLFERGNFIRSIDGERP
jgi:phosphopantothenoylcysteine decarboxylase/phosphopantothenate--cysteine ligase